MKKTTVTTEQQQSETVVLTRVDYDALMAQIALIELLRKDNARLQEQLDLFKEQIILASNKRFGASSEKTNSVNMDQLDLFNEAETIADTDAGSAPAAEEQVDDAKEPEKKTRKPKVSVLKSLPASIPVKDVVIELNPEDKICPKCGGDDFTVIGTELVREEIVLVPATVEKRRYMITSYACNSCKPVDDTVTDVGDTETVILKSKAPAAVIKGGNTSPEAVAQIAVEKYVKGVPLYRQEQDFKRNGIQLTRQVMAGWLIYCAIYWLQPIYGVLHEMMVQYDYLMADETTTQVLNEEGKTPQSKSFMWVYRTGAGADMQIVLYDYQPDRKGVRPVEFLKGFKGILSVDGYAGYNGLTVGGGVTIAACWGHARRYWNDALKCMNPQERIGSTAAIGENYCNKLFKIERDIADKSYDEKYELRQQLAVPVLEKFKAWLDTLNPASKSHLGKAVTYCRNQWKELNTYLIDGRVELSNNRTERTVKPYVINRKNFLFSNTPGGADASAMFTGMIETAKENGLNPYKYLKYIFEKAPSMNLQDKDAVRILLPNDPTVHLVCAVPEPVSPSTHSISETTQG